VRVVSCGSQRAGGRHGLIGFPQQPCKESYPHQESEPSTTNHPSTRASRSGRVTRRQERAVATNRPIRKGAVADCESPVARERIKRQDPSPLAQLGTADPATTNRHSRPTRGSRYLAATAIADWPGSRITPQAGSTSVRARGSRRLMTASHDHRGGHRLTTVDAPAADFRSGGRVTIQ
jgi:hypothetical protein